MAAGEQDLFAEFLDLLRSYGCTEENDIQLRHGTRYSLILFEKAGRSFVHHRDPREMEKRSDYKIIHKPHGQEEL